MFLTRLGAASGWQHGAAQDRYPKAGLCYDVQALLSHQDYATTQRYARLAPDVHGKVIESRNRRALQAPDAPVTHERKKAGPSQRETGL